MKTGGMDCIDCHGGMLAVGGEYTWQAAASTGPMMVENAALGKIFHAASPVIQAMR